MKTSKLMVPFSCLLLGLAFLACSGEESKVNVSESASETFAGKNPLNSKKGSDWTAIPEGRMFTYSPYFDRQFLYSDFEYGLDVFTREFFGDTWYTWQKSFSTSYAIEHVRGRTSEEYVVGGFDEQTGETVLEGWRFLTPDGAYASLRSPSSSSIIGTGIPFSTRSVDITTGAFVIPANRTQPAPPQKQVLYRGTEFRLQDFIIDPDGRYILVQDGLTGSIFKIVNQQATLIADPQVHPLLLGAYSMHYLQDANFDRVLRLTTLEPYPQKVFMLHDADNNGIIEFIGAVLTTDFFDTYPKTYDIPGGEPQYEFVR